LRKPQREEHPAKELEQMEITTKWTRRGFMGGISVFVGALLNGKRLLANPGGTGGVDAGITGFGHSGNVYEELGVTPLINGQGTMTMLGGSLMRPEVEAVMAMAGRHFVSIPELEVAAGKRIAKMLNLPEGYSAIVTSGAAAAMQSGLSGILTKDNPKFILQLPDLTGMKSEVIIQKSHRNPFDHQLRSSGVKLIEIETREELRKAVNEKTAMMHFTNFANGAGQIKVDEWPRLAKELNIPTFIDAAADTPPVSHLWDYATMGYDLIAFSGGKAIRGPQCAGLLLGRKDLVGYALLNNSPYEDTLGRSQKVGKEEIVGMVKALESYLKEDHEALNREWQRRLEVIVEKVGKVRGVTTTYWTPDVANHVPHLDIGWDRKHISLTPEQAVTALRAGKPAIVVASDEHPGWITMKSFMLQPGEEKIIADALSSLFKERSSWLQA
jgi:L-seryl-tRNA(Ser) seleniumtransferase